MASEALRPTRINVNLSEVLEVAQRHQPEYLSQILAVERSNINLLVAQNSKLWDVSVVAGASQFRDRLPDTYSDSTSRTWEAYTGIQVDIPFGDLSRRQPEVRARVELEKQEILLAETLQILRRDVENAVRNLDTRWRQLEISQRARDLSAQKLEIEKEKLVVGRSSNFQVLSYESDLRNSESAQLNALISYLNAQANLDQVLGTTLQSWNITLNE